MGDTAQREAIVCCAACLNCKTVLTVFRSRRSGVASTAAPRWRTGWERRVATEHKLLWHRGDGVGTTTAVKDTLFPCCRRAFGRRAVRGCSVLTCTCAVLHLYVCRTEPVEGEEEEESEGEEEGGEEREGRSRRRRSGAGGQDATADAEEEESGDDDDDDDEGEEEEEEGEGGVEEQMNAMMRLLMPSMVDNVARSVASDVMVPVQPLVVATGQLTGQRVRAGSGQGVPVWRPGIGGQCVDV